MAENSINVSKKTDELLQYLENNFHVKNIDESVVELIFNSLTNEGNDGVSTDDFVDLFTEYYVNADNSADISEINEQFMSAFSDIASIDGNSEEFSRDELDIFLDTVKNSNEYNDLEYADDERIKTDEDTTPSTEIESTLEAEPDIVTDDNSEALDAALSDIYAELEKQKSEIETEAESKTGFGAAWNAIKGVFGGGTKGELSEIEELEELYQSVSENPTEEAVKELYETVFCTELDLETVNEGSEISEELMNGSYRINGTEISTEDVVNALEEQVAALDESFSEDVNSQGIISKGISWLNNNLLGIGTTKDMTQSQIDELSNQVNKLKNAESAEEFASLYKSITGEDLSEESLSELFEGETSKLEDTTAAELMIDYENTTDNIKNTVIAVGVGVATAATGGIAGAVALGIGATVAVNAIDAGTQDNGQNVGENLLEYAQTDMVKDAFVGAINGFTGKLGNMAGEKLVSTFAAKKLGSTAATELVETTMEQAAAKGLSTAAQQSAANAALKGTLSTGTRILTEFADGALDAGLSSAGEYLVSAAAGENGNFTNEDGKLTNDDGSLALFDNFKENFDAAEMAEQVVVSTLLGGFMSAGMQEGMYFISKGIDSVKSGGGDDVKIDTDTNDVKIDDYVNIDTGTDDVKTYIDTNDVKIDTDNDDVKINIDTDNHDVKIYNTDTEDVKIDDDVNIDTDTNVVNTDTNTNDVKIDDYVNIDTGTDDVNTYTGTDDIKIDTGNDDVKINTDTDNDDVKIYNTDTEDVKTDTDINNFKISNDPADYKTGDIVQSANYFDHIGIKLSDGSIQELNISYETFRKLFPDGYDLNIAQSGVGDCYLVSSIYSLMKNPDTRVIVLQCFTENADGSITVKFPNGNIEFTFDAGKNMSDYVSTTKIVSGSEGIAMLEYTYGLELVDKQYKELSEELRRAVESNADEVQINKLMDKISSLVDNKGVYEQTLRDEGGYMDSVYSMFGLDSGWYSSGSDEFKELLFNTDNWSKYVFGAGTKHASSTDYLDAGLDILEGHAYTINPKLTSSGEIEIEITNPWHTYLHTTLTIDQFLKYFTGLYYAKIE